MKKTMTLALMVVALAAGAAQADMSFSAFFYESCLDASGHPIANGTYVMLIDLDNDGWNGNDYLTTGGALGNSWLFDADDLILDRGRIGEGGWAGDAYPFRNLATAAIPATYTVGVDHLFVLWFDTPFSSAAMGPGPGVRYGVEDLGTVGADPGDYTFDGVGGKATLTTLVPEPATMSLLGLGLGGLIAARRRRGAK